MKKTSLKNALPGYRIGTLSLAVILLSLFLFSFTVKTVTGDFLEQLGISKTKADEKIINSMLGGYLDQYGISKARNIVSGKKALVVKDLISYAKEKLNSPEFVAEYNRMRNNAKPLANTMQTPDEMQKQMVEQYRKSVKEIEATIAKSDAANKKLFEGLLEDAKKQLKIAEDPNNEMIKIYRSNYDETVSMNAAAHDSQVADWEKEYPADHRQFIKKRLQQFLDETSGIDFSAQLTEKNGRKYFVNRNYEYKSNRWKMGFRAGKEVVETAREEVRQWIQQL